MNILSFFETLSKESKTSKQNIEVADVYIERRRFKDLFVSYHMRCTIKSVTGVISEHSCCHEPCCFYKGKLGKLQVANLTTGQYEIFDIKKHEIPEELQEHIRKVITDSINVWMNSYEYLKGPKRSIVKYDNMFGACR
jgi:hypothetical protein